MVGNDFGYLRINGVLPSLLATPTTITTGTNTARPTGGALHQRNINVWKVQRCSRAVSILGLGTLNAGSNRTAFDLTLLATNCALIQRTLAADVLARLHFYNLSLLDVYEYFFHGYASNTTRALLALLRLHQNLISPSRHSQASRSCFEMGWSHVANVLVSATAVGGGRRSAPQCPSQRQKSNLFPVGLQQTKFKVSVQTSVHIPVFLGTARSTP